MNTVEMTTPVLIEIINKLKAHQCKQAEEIKQNAKDIKEINDQISKMLKLLVISDASMKTIIQGINIMKKSMEEEMGKLYKEIADLKHQIYSMRRN